MATRTTGKVILRTVLSGWNGPVGEKEEAQAEAKLARFDAGAAELAAAGQDAADAAVAVDRELARLVDALKR